jgi:hypothetical protein
MRVELVGQNVRPKAFRLRTEYKIPRGFSPSCLERLEALHVARELIREGYPPRLVFETLLTTLPEPSYGANEIRLLAKQCMDAQLDDGAVIDPNDEPSEGEPSDETTRHGN